MLVPVFLEEVVVSKGRHILYQVPGIVIVQDNLEAVVSHVKRIHGRALALGEQGDERADVGRTHEGVGLPGLDCGRKGQGISLGAKPSAQKA